MTVLDGPEVRPPEAPLRYQARSTGCPSTNCSPRTTRSVFASPSTFPAARPYEYQPAPALSILLTVPVVPDLVKPPRYSQVSEPPTTARSGEPSPVKSPVATSRPKWLCAPAFGVTSVPPERPVFEPQTTVTEPRYCLLPTCSVGLPTTRSA